MLYHELGSGRVSVPFVIFRKHYDIKLLTEDIID